MTDYRNKQQKERIMATWHQNRNRAGTAALYSRPAKGYKVVVDPLNGFASAVEFTRKRDAEKFIRNCRKLRGETGILISAKGN
jgi:hypothetical protein